MRLPKRYRRHPFKTDRLGAAALLFIPLLMLSTSTAGAQAVGTVKTRAGDVRLERAGHPVALAPGLAVLKGDRFTTGADGRVTILLNDESRLGLEPSGVLEINGQAPGANGRTSTRVSVLSGDLRSVVHLSAGGPLPDFEVQTPNAIAAAQRADFNTGYHRGTHRIGYDHCSDFTDIFTREGKVQVTSLGKPETPTQVDANQNTTVACGTGSLPPKPGIGAMALYTTSTAAVLGGAIGGAGAGISAGFGSSGGSSDTPPKDPETPSR